MLLSDKQHGGRYNRTTSLALELFGNNTKSIDDGKYTLADIIDIKTALVTIDRNILIQILHILCVWDIANSYIASYFSNRMQYVDLCDCMSDLSQAQCGVPQIYYSAIYCLFYTVMMLVMHQE